MTAAAEKVPVSSWIDRELRQKLERLAIEGDRSLSAEVRRALVTHIERVTIPDSRGAPEMRMTTRIRGSSDAPPVDQEELRAARREAARANAYWQELEEPALVRRAMFLVHADEDTLWTGYRGTVWDPGSANVIFNADLPMTFYVDPDGDVRFIERRPGLWSDIVARQARKSRAAT